MDFSPLHRRRATENPVVVGCMYDKIIVFISGRCVLRITRKFRLIMFFVVAVAATSLCVKGVVPAASAEKRVYPDVLKVSVRKSAAGVFRFEVTISSPDTGWKKYANAFRVKTEDDKVLGTRVLYHPHVDEQPFTRSLVRVRISSEIREAVVDARDSVEGWGGKSMRVVVPH